MQDTGHYSVMTLWYLALNILLRVSVRPYLLQSVFFQACRWSDTCMIRLQLMSLLLVCDRYVTLIDIYVTLIDIYVTLFSNLVQVTIK